ncbi:hypothetical protein KC19_7G036100 [Ceratodon purpureus]|uniref:Uncharacterized protein n=1 Tax=Ceratodon purpureus TaxID=3225 RepID=A0A8T0H5T6_CERPU|nr:hypothetical protein KC19_7G036100 [Ceratodon purpureus]
MCSGGQWRSLVVLNSAGQVTSNYTSLQYQKVRFLHLTSFCLFNLCNQIYAVENKHFKNKISWSTNRLVIYIIYEICLSCLAEREVLCLETRSAYSTGLLATLRQPAVETILPKCNFLTLCFN